MSIKEYGVAKGQLSNKETWISFWVLFFFATIWMFSNVKPNPVMLDFSMVYGFDMANMGNIMVVSGIAGMIFSLPCAWIIRQIGVKATCVVTAIVGILGSIICYFASSAGLFLAGRFVEGIAFGFASVVGPNAMPRLFPVSKLGNAMGIWSLWVTPGIILSFATGPALFGAFGARGLILFCIVVEVILTVIMLIFFKMPAVELNTIVEGDVTKKRVIGKPHTAWAIVIALSFVCWCIIYGTYTTFYATYLQTVQGFAPAYSGLICLMAVVATIPAGFIVGRIFDKAHLAKHFIWIGYLLTAIIVGTIGFQEAPSVVLPWVFTLILGFVCASMVPIGTRTIIPLLAKDSAKTDYALGIMGFVTQFGSIAAGAFFGPLMAGVGFYHAALYMLVPVAVVAMLICLFCPSDKKLYQEEVDAQL